MENTKGKLRYCPVRDGAMGEWAVGDGLDKQLECGYYLVEILHTEESQGLPVKFCGDEHYILAHLLVTESGTGDKLQKNRVVGQTLVFTDRLSSSTGVYSRSGEHTTQGVVWGEWAQASAKNGGAKDVTWGNDSNIDIYTEQGTYSIAGERLNAGDGLPIDNASPGHTVSARLVVLDSSISGTGDSDDKCVTQILALSNRAGGDGDVYVRTGRAASKNLLAGGTGWEQWGKLQTNVEVGQVASLNSFTDNGIYSGVYTDGSSFFETFVMVVINNYSLVNVTGNVRSISQFKYALEIDGTFSYKTRVGQGNTGISWGEWVSLGAASTHDIQDNSITEQKLSTDVREKVNNPLRSLYIAAGATYDKSTGLYSLNGVNDLTEEQMLVCYENKDICRNLNWGGIGRYMSNLRTIYPIPVRDTISVSQLTNGWKWNCFYAFYNCAALEIFRISTNASLDTTEPSKMLAADRLFWAFHSCVKLHTVYPINVGEMTKNTPFQNTFYGCSSLVNLRLYGLKDSISLAQSPLISKESLLYIINNSQATSAITITLHADAYATLAEDTDIISVLEAQPLVTLVSA